MNLRVTSIALLVLALLGVSALTSVAAARWADAEEEEGEESAESLLELSLPALPEVPLMRPGERFFQLRVNSGDAKADAAAAAARFRSLDSETDRHFDADEHDDEDEADGENDNENENENEGEDEADDQAEDEEGAEDEETDDAPRFSAPPAAMRFASAMSRRYDSNTLPSGPLPVQPSQPYYHIAQLPVSAVGDALAVPIVNSVRTFPGTQPPAASLAAGANSYAWAKQKKYDHYAYGNTQWGAPVNSAYYPQPPAPGGPTLVPAFRPLEPYVAAATANLPAAPTGAAPTAPAAAAAPASAEEASFFEAAGVAHAGRVAWPSSIPRPAAYFLPPDLII